MVLRNFAAGLATHEPAAELRPDVQVPYFPNLIDLKFGNRAAAAYKASAEMRDAVPHRLIKAIDDVTFPAAGFVVIAFTFAGRKRLAPETIALSIAVVGFVLADTLLCTAVSGVFDRYQARVTWLVVCVALLLLLSQFSPKTSGPRIPKDAASVAVACQSQSLGWDTARGNAFLLARSCPQLFGYFKFPRRRQKRRCALAPE